MEGQSYASHRAFLEVEDCSKAVGVGKGLAIRRIGERPGKYVLTGSWDKTMRLWDGMNGKELHKFITLGPVNDVAFSPDGKYVLAASDDRNAWMWDAVTGQEVRKFSGGGVGIHGIQRAVFSSDGRYVATASADGTARIFDVATGQELRRLVATGPLNSLAFSPDGRYLLTSSGDGAAQQWDVDYRTTVHYLCSRLVRDFTDDERGQFDISDKDPNCPTQ